MNAAEWDVEEKPREGGVVTITYTVVDPGTVVVHLHNTSVERKKEREGRRRAGQNDSHCRVVD